MVSRTQHTVVPDVMAADPDDDAASLGERIRQTGADAQQVLAEVLARHGARLRKMVQLRMDPRLQGRIDPSDVLQEAYLEASARFAEYLKAPAMPVFAWLRFITSQELMVLHRRHLGAQARDAGREISLERRISPEASSAILADQLVGRLTTPTQAARRTERKALLERSLNQMDPLDREVLLLRHFEELTNHETAHLLGISPTAANNRYVRALRRLKEILDSMPGGGQELGP